MYAIFESGGKQHRVSTGDVIALEKLPVDPGKKVNFDKVLLVSDDKNTQVGTPLLKGAKVSAIVVAQERDKKITVFKKKRRKKYRRTQGHRQSITRVRIEAISA
ncbi:MAG: 50S ribosomal protein L21 [Leptospirillia bacterium]